MTSRWWWLPLLVGFTTKCNVPLLHRTGYPSTTKTLNKGDLTKRDALHENLSTSDREIVALLSWEAKSKKKAFGYWLSNCQQQFISWTEKDEKKKAHLSMICCWTQKQKMTHEFNSNREQSMIPNKIYRREHKKYKNIYIDAKDDKIHQTKRPDKLLLAAQCGYMPSPGNPSGWLYVLWTTPERVLTDFVPLLLDRNQTTSDAF